MSDVPYIGAGTPIGHPIRELQRALTRAGFPVKDDGEWGPQTRGAVLAFQGANSLARDGMAGPVTWTMLGRQGALAGGTDVARDALYTLVGIRNQLTVFAIAAEDSALLSVIGEVDARLVALVGGPLPETPVGVSPTGVGFAPLVLGVAAGTFADAAVAAAGWTACIIAAAWAGKKLGDAARKRAPSYADKRRPYDGELRRGGSKPPLRADLEINARKFLRRLVKAAGALTVWTAALVGHFALGVASKAGSASVGILVALVAAVFALGKRKG